MATILAFDRKCSTWCAVQYLPLQGLNSQAVLHQSLEDMKVFEFPEVQDFYQIPPILMADYFISWMREQSLVLFSPSGKRKMDTMKLFEHPEVLEFDQRGEKCT